MSQPDNKDDFRHDDMHRSENSDNSTTSSDHNNESLMIFEDGKDRERYDQKLVAHLRKQHVNLVRQQRKLHSEHELSYKQKMIQFLTTIFNPTDTPLVPIGAEKQVQPMNFSIFGGLTVDQVPSLSDQSLSEVFRIHHAHRRKNIFSDDDEQDRDIRPSDARGEHERMMNIKLDGQ